MQDKNDPIESDDFEDMDFEDLDADGDFDDESWDDFDEEPTNEVETSESSNVSTDDSGVGPTAASQKKTFLQKNFNMIVIGVAVLGGGGFILSKLSSPPSNVALSGDATYEAAVNLPSTGQVPSPLSDDKTMPENPEDILDLNDGFPPMPTPIESVDSEQTALNSNEVDNLNLGLEDSSLQESSSDILTPLPDLFTEDTDAPLENLDIAAEERILNSAETTLLLDTTDSEAALTTELGDDLILDMAPPLIAETDDNMLTPESIEESTLPLEVFSIQSPETEIISADIANTEEVVSTEKLPTRADDEALNAAKEAETLLKTELKTAENEIKTLNSTVSNLQDEIETLKVAMEKTEKAAVKNATESISTPAPEPKIEITSAPSVSKLASKKPQEKAVSAKKDKPLQWVLRSAQPGEATISSKASGDLRRIEIGDTISGLGKIQSIKIENGRWVVRGSKNSVSQ